MRALDLKPGDVIKVTDDYMHPSEGHGFNIGKAFNVWILDSLIHHNSGDAIQFCHYCVKAENGGPGAVYISGNVMHSDEENAIDMKEFTGPVMFSNNELYNYWPLGFSGSGEAIRVNDEGSQGEVWFIRNNIHDNKICMNPDDSAATSYAVDNVCTDNDFGIIDGFKDQAGNVIDGKSDRIDPAVLYDLFESTYGLSIRP